MKRKRASARNPALALQGTPAGFGLSDRSAACPEPLGDLRRAPRALFIHCDTTDSELQGKSVGSTAKSYEPRTGG